MADEYYVDPETEEQFGEAYQDTVAGVSIPSSRRKDTIIEFINRVFDSKETTKGSFMEEEEVSAIRAFLRAENYSNAMFGNESLLSDYFRNRAEIVAAPTLGRQGNLIKAAITTKKEFQATMKQRKQNKSWFRKKEETEQPNM